MQRANQSHERFSLIPTRIIPWIMALIVLVVLTSGCEPKFLLTLASDNESIPHPAFRVGVPDHSDQRPQYHTIQLITHDRQVLWHLRAEPFGDRNSVKQFRYAQPLAGFVTVVEPVALQVGQVYYLYVGGNGLGVSQVYGANGRSRKGAGLSSDRAGSFGNSFSEVVQRFRTGCDNPGVALASTSH